MFRLYGQTKAGVKVDREATSFVDTSGTEHDVSAVGVASFVDIAPGKYHLEEKTAKDGYKRITTIWEVTVDTDGNLNVEGEGLQEAEGKFYNYLLKNEPIIVKISKTDLGGTEIEGAQIEVKDSTGSVVDSWKSTTEAHELNLSAGEYTMTEVVAPGGFEKVTTEIKFTVDEEGKVTLGTTKVDNGGKIEVLKGEHIVLRDAPAKPAIEKYVNKKVADGDLNNAETGRDETVHTDLSAFDEVYTYDIQAYITADAKYVEVHDELREVLEFAGDAPTAVVVKDGDGDNGAVAPKLTKEGNALEDYTIDADAWKEGRLVLTIGEDSEDAKVLYPNGKWLQITFDAKIKDEFKSVEALKAKGEKVWTAITENDPIDAPDAVDEFSGATGGSHEGIVNDSYYNINKIKAEAGAEVDNEWQYTVKSNTVTVQPESTEVSFSKKELGGDELEGAKMKLVDSEGNVIDSWTSTKEDYVLHLTDGEYILIEEVAPEGYYCVTTEMKFAVRDGKAELLTTSVDAGGKLTLMEGNKIVLEDAPVVEDDYREVPPPKDNKKDKVRGVYKTEEETVRTGDSGSNTTTSVKSVNTGDNATMYIWLLGLMMAMSAIVIVNILRRRNNR